MARQGELRNSGESAQPGELAFVGTTGIRYKGYLGREMCVRPDVINARTTLVTTHVATLVATHVAIRPFLSMCLGQEHNFLFGLATKIKCILYVYIYLAFV